MAYAEPVDGTDEICLILTRKEALALRALTGSISGPTINSPRVHTNKIWNALKSVQGTGTDHLKYRTLLQTRPRFSEWVPRRDPVK